MSWPSPPAVSQRKATVSQRSHRAPARPRIRSSRLLPRARALQRPEPAPPAACSARLRARTPTHALCAQRPTPALLLRTPRAPTPCLRAFCAPSACSSSHNTLLYCDSLQPSSHCPSCCVTIQFLCIKTQSLSQLAILLQYSPASISAIQTTVLQHKTHPTCNTIFLQPIACNKILILQYNLFYFFTI